jgi:hypothetical protein
MALCAFGEICYLVEHVLSRMCRAVALALGVRDLFFFK